MVGVVISNLIVIIEIIIHIEECGVLKPPVTETSVLSSPETTLGIKGLKEEHLTQAVQTLGNFAKRILGSTR